MRFLTALAVALACGCSSHEEPARAGVEGWDREIAVPVAIDRNPDPNVVEIDLEARLADVEIRPGVKTRAWTYDGGVPGPTIRAKVGDELVVHFKNSLPEATTIHWHGVRVPNAMDGAGGPSIAAGATFEYRFRLPDAGTYWYHPHVHSAAQVGYGLYGALIVEDPGEPWFGDEATIVLSDVGLLEDGTIGDATLGGPIADLFGREGDPMLANGKVAPTIHARAGRPQRWRLVNAAKSRYFQLVMEGHVFHRIGGDGGLRESPVDTARLLLVPGERADVVVVPKGAPGAVLPLRWVPFDRGYGSAFARDPETVLSVRIDAAAEQSAQPLPTRLRSIAPISLEGALRRRVEFTQMEEGGTTVFGIDGARFPAGEPLRAKVGDTDVWEVVNSTDWNHPFHLHGFFFQVLGNDGVPEGEWKDTIDVPKKESRSLVVRYDDRPGAWMFHCHILDHADLGMMSTLIVEGDGTTVPTPPGHAH